MEKLTMLQLQILNHALKELYRQVSSEEKGSLNIDIKEISKLQVMVRKEIGF